MSRILVTGGAGYIGATAVEMLLEQGHQISVLDDCSTGHAESLPSSVFFVEGSPCFMRLLAGVGSRWWSYWS